MVDLLPIITVYLWMMFGCCNWHRKSKDTHLWVSFICKDLLVCTGPIKISLWKIMLRNSVWNLQLRNSDTIFNLGKTPCTNFFPNTFTELRSIRSWTNSDFRIKKCIRSWRANSVCYGVGVGKMTSADA